LIGCGWQEFVSYITPMLVGNGWTWSDYGAEWVIDHRLPLRAFNLRDRRELLACFNYRNLRPMDPQENRQKNGTFDPRARDIYVEEFCASSAP
jgi:hypothetical protein